MAGSEAGASQSNTRADAPTSTQTGTQTDKQTDADETEGSAAGTVSRGGRALDFPVVGIGASAGGVQALLRFFENAPADIGMAFVVVLHLSPKHESSADQVLQRVTRMPVLQVQHPCRSKRTTST